MKHALTNIITLSICFLAGHGIYLIWHDPFGVVVGALVSVYLLFNLFDWNV